MPPTVNPVYAGTLAQGLSFPEAPRWHRSGLWFSDFYQHRVCRVGPAGALEVVAEVPHQPSGLGWLPDGDLLVVSMLDHQVLRVSQGRVSVHADLSAWVSAPCNDMVVAADGVAYVGNFGFNRHQGEAEKNTVLLRVDPDGTVSVAASEVCFPNGAALSADGRRLYLAETFGHRITRFAVAPDGSLNRREVFYEADGFFPDGLCLDGQENLWVADPVAKHLLQLDRDARVQATLRLPEDRLPIACAVGGEGADRLFVASSIGLGPAMAESRGGRIEVFSLERS